MKTIFKLAIALLAVFSFAACSDVPMPYEEPGTGNTEEPTTEAEAKGTGTAADPYNVAAALKTVSALAAGEETPTAIYVKGAVKEIKEIETEKYGNANYYITDDGKNQIYIFQSYYLGNRKFTANDKLTVGDTVVVYGKFTNYQGNTPETVGKGTSYIYSLNGETAGTTPETPTTSEPKGSGTQADPYNAAAANKAAEGLKDGEEKKDVYVSGIISQIKELSTQFGNASFYISDDGKTEGSQFYVFRALYLNGDKFTAEDQIKVGQKVVVKGSLVNFKGNTPELAQGGQVVSIEGNGTTTPETPTSGEAVSISGTTVTLTNTKATAGTETSTIDLNAQGYDNAQAVSEVKFSDGTTATFAKGNGSTNPAFYTKTKGVRVYLNNTITFNATKPIAKIVFTCDALSSTDYVGNKTATVTFSGNTAVYTNAAPSATDGGVQLRVQTITITYAK